MLSFFFILDNPIVRPQCMVLVPEATLCRLPEKKKQKFIPLCPACFQKDKRTKIVLSRVSSHGPADVRLQHHISQAMEFMLTFKIQSQPRQTQDCTLDFLGFCKPFIIQIDPYRRALIITLLGTKNRSKGLMNC